MPNFGKLIFICWISTVCWLPPASTSSIKSTSPDVSKVRLENVSYNPSSNSNSEPYKSGLLLLIRLCYGSDYSYRSAWHRNRSSVELRSVSQLPGPEQRLGRRHVSDHWSLLREMQLRESQFSHQNGRSCLHVPVSAVGWVNHLLGDSIANGLHEDWLNHNSIGIAAIRQN